MLACSHWGWHRAGYTAQRVPETQHPTRPTGTRDNQGIAADQSVGPRLHEACCVWRSLSHLGSDPTSLH